MHGKETLKRSAQRNIRAQSRAKTRKQSYLTIGNWRLEENSDGDLVLTNLKTQKTIIIGEEGD